jgi:bifunctional oligoribonuclease and PAP phosphatase NrnA
MADFEKLREIFISHSSFLITTHVNPDADAIGSQMALYKILKKLNKKVYAVNHSETPYYLEFLDDEKIIEKFDPSLHEDVIRECEVIIVEDLNYVNRTVRMEKAIRESKGIKICIDHHQEPENFFDFKFTGSEYSATGEIIYDFLQETKITELDYPIAVNLYAAIMTDTGSFRFERTSPKIHRIMADLLEKGVNPTAVYDAIYDQSRISKVKLLGETLAGIQLNEAKNLSWMIITREMIERSGAEESEVDGYVNFCMSIENIKIGILFFELKDGIKISFRSKGNIHVNKLAGEFGGGGHINASGARLFNIKLDDCIPAVLKSAEKYLA